MAEIKIEKKKPILPWILLFLGVLALIYFLVIRDTENDPLRDNDDVEHVEIETTTSQNLQNNHTYFLA